MKMIEVTLLAELAQREGYNGWDDNKFMADLFRTAICSQHPKHPPRVVQRPACPPDSPEVAAWSAGLTHNRLLELEEQVKALVADVGGLIAEVGVVRMAVKSNCETSEQHPVKPKEPAIGTWHTAIYNDGGVERVPIHRSGDGGHWIVWRDGLRITHTWQHVFKNYIDIQPLEMGPCPKCEETEILERVRSLEEQLKFALVANRARVEALEQVELPPSVGEALKLGRAVVDAGRGGVAECDAFLKAAAAVEENFRRKQAPLTKAEREVLAERQKQRVRWGDDHDDEHQESLLHAARCLLSDRTLSSGGREDYWNLYEKNPKKRDRLVIVAALLLAELDREDRAG